MITNHKNNRIAVCDFFCGCGGTSRGFQKAGMDIAFALDVDQDAKNTFERNFPTTVFCDKSIKDLTASDLQDVLAKYRDSYKLFCGCAPCQPFTKQNTASPKQDERKDLLTYFGAIVKECQPDFVFVENVPGLQKVPKDKHGPFPALMSWHSLVRRTRIRRRNQCEWSATRLITKSSTSPLIVLI